MTQVLDAPSTTPEPPEQLRAPKQKRGADGLRTPGWLYVVMAVGLIAFSVYSFSEAAWRRIEMDVPL